MPGKDQIKKKYVHFHLIISLFFFTASLSPKGKKALSGWAGQKQHSDARGIAPCLMGEREPDPNTGCSSPAEGAGSDRNCTETQTTDSRRMWGMLFSFVFQHVWLLKENIVSSFESFQLQHRPKRKGAERTLRRCGAPWIPSLLTLKHVCSFQTPNVSVQ